MIYIKPDIEEIEDNVYKVIYNSGNILYIIGTAHVSENSAQLVEDKIREIKPDTVCIELDEQRYENIVNKRHNDISILQIIKKGQIFFFAGQLILFSFQKKISVITGSRPGEEFLRVINLSGEYGYKIHLIDRKIEITLKRAWRLTPFRKRFNFFISLLFSCSNDFENINIEELKKKDAVDYIIQSFSKELPEAKKVLIDERDIYLAHGIQNKSGIITIAVVGAGHIHGILKNLSVEISDDIKNELDCIPAKTRFWHRGSSI